MNFKFTPPTRYDLNRIILGESPTTTGVLLPIASSVSIGTFPNWISEYEYSSSVESYYYSIQWEYNNGTYSDWSSPRLTGRTGIETNYIIVNASGDNSIYIMIPVSGDAVDYGEALLDYNKEYYVTIDKDLSGAMTLPMTEDYVLTFTSQYCPKFSTIDDIRFTAGPFIENITDDTINRIIHKNSVYIIRRYLGISTDVTSTYSCDGSELDYAFKNYVKCKSALDAITAVELSLGANSSKKLGDMAITYGGLNQNNDPFTKKNELKECIDVSLDIILSGGSHLIGVRGKYYEPKPHPFNDSTFGRLSLSNSYYNNNMRSIFDKVTLGD